MLHPAVRRALLKAQLALREIQALSPRTMRAIVANSVRMSLHDARWQRTHRNADAPLDAGRYTGASLTDDGRAIAVTFERATLHVTALRDELVRLSWGPGVAPCDVATRDAVFEPVYDVVVDVGTVVVVGAAPRGW